MARSSAVENIGDINKKHAKQVKNSVKQIKKTLKSPEMDMARINNLWKDYHNSTLKWHRDILDVRFKLKKHISREDWAKIISAP